ncbi:hypothetical protein JCM19301_2967 [Jejuia pallidilutea]|uniref:Uncharacterized protein n=1 Tax=Jejuia pallidilutea TaxID=504487 RepID=A0A090WP46_9FLAO|nr:hypothetical protein JCM19301_2967 [Jejuia pallidilutea]
MVGFSSSVTVTVCVHEAEFPELSVTVQVTIVSPSGNVLGASLVTVDTTQSDVVGVPKFTPEAEQSPASADTDILAGQLIVGSTLSITVTVCVQVAVFPEPSVTVQVTIVSPNGYVLGASLVTEATEQLSSVIGVPKFTVETSQAAASILTLMLAGQVIVGFSSSVTVTVCVQVVVFPEPSVINQVTVVSPKPNSKVIGSMVVPFTCASVVATEQLSLDTGVPRATVVYSFQYRHQRYWQ